MSDRAEQALERIAKHERECAERWGECVVELRELRKTTDAHAKRWEKLAWLVVASAITGLCSVIVNHVQ